MFNILQYKSQLIVGVIVVAVLTLAGIGVYVKGRSDGVALTEAKVAAEKREWERQVADLQLKHQKEVADLLADYNSKVDQYKEEIAKLADNPKVVERFIDRYVPVQTQCTIPQGFVDLHNKAAQGASLSEIPTGVNKPTDKSLGDVGSIVAQNYYTCNDIRARLEALQQIIIKYQQQQKELVK